MSSDSITNELKEIEQKINDFTNTKWSPVHESILIDWADKAMCYRWLHSRAHAMYSRLNAWYTIPVIIISTVTGTANFAQERVPYQYQTFFLMCVGGFNILAGIISTIQQFLKITQLNESHRVSSISWDKFYRNLKMELAKHPKERMDVGHVLKISKEEYDRLMETSPDVPKKIINLFKKSFKHSESFLEIKKPEICDVMVSTEKYRNPWFSEKNMSHVNNERKLFLETKQKLLKKLDDENEKIVDNFTIMFKNMNHREPLQNEIIENLREKIEQSVLEKIVERKMINMEIISSSNADLDNII
jgi:hypothetical protein